MGLNTGAKAVVSNQEGIYQDLAETVQKYARTKYLRPIADHTREAFAVAEKFVEDFYRECVRVAPAQGRGDSGDVASSGRGDSGAMAVILDSGCGTGESTLHIARRFPNIPVIGIDKSGERLTKAGNEHQLMNLVTPAQGRDDSGNVPSNVFWVRAELLDFWRLALERVQENRWTIPYHALYYPNPWPKQSEATRRFHLHPIFSTFMALSPVTELRTNWEIYAREFAAAARIVCDSASPRDDSSEGSAEIRCETFDPAQPETAFERKYKEARQQLWRVLVKR